MAPRLWRLLGLGLTAQLLWCPPRPAPPAVFVSGRGGRREGRLAVGSRGAAAPGSGRRRPRARALAARGRGRGRGARAAAAAAAAARGAAAAAARGAGAGDGRLEDALDAQVATFAEVVLPRASHRRTKRQLVSRLEGVARKALDPRARVFGFGSSLNGCGEASSDIDLVVHVPPEADVVLDVREALHKVAAVAQEGGFAVLETRMTATVPIVTLEMLDDECKPTGYTCDVSFQRLLPLHNTRLLRTYVELMPELTALIVVVKRWAKSSGVAGTYEHFISTYSWTLAVVYYCQVVHGLPSLHALALQQPAPAKPGRGRGQGWPGEHEDGGGVGVAHNVHFVGLPAARRLLGSAKPWEAGGLGALLRGFFEFYAQEYDWCREVISVRLGQRTGIDDPAFSAQLRKTTVRKRGGRRVVVVDAFQAFHIEDPIEVERNLNFALRPWSLRRIHAALQEAHVRLMVGAELAELLDLEGLPQPQPRRGRRGHRPWQAGYLGLGRRPPCQCGTCGMRFKNYAAMLDHERGCSVLSRLLLNAMGG